MRPRPGDATLNGKQQELPPADDAVDAALASAGDTVAFERLYRRHVPRIFGLCLRMADAQDADELTQEIFLRSWQKLGSFQGKSAFGTWLYRVGVNVILTRRAGWNKRRQRETSEEDLVHELPARAAHVDARMDFETALGHLPDGAKEILLLHDVEGFKHEEIADMLTISVGTSKSQLHRARMMLRGILRS